MQAEYSDVMMYARLVRGMTEHGAVLHADQSGNQHGHALSRKSLMGVVKCRQRPIPEEGHEDEAFSSNHPTQAANANAHMPAAADSGWSIGYSYEESQGFTVHPHSQRGINAPDRQHSNATGPQEHKHCREVSGDSSNQADEDEDDDCVFSLEM